MIFPALPRLADVVRGRRRCRGMEQPRGVSAGVAGAPGLWGVLVVRGVVVCGSCGFASLLPDLPGDVVEVGAFASGSTKGPGGDPDAFGGAFASVFDPGVPGSGFQPEHDPHRCSDVGPERLGRVTDDLLGGDGPIIRAAGVAGGEQVDQVRRVGGKACGADAVAHRLPELLGERRNVDRVFGRHVRSGWGRWSAPAFPRRSLLSCVSPGTRGFGATLSILTRWTTSCGVCVH